MKTFPGESRAWIGKQDREAGVVGERWHVYLELHGVGRRASQWIEQVWQIALDALPDELKSALSVVEPRFRHATNQMISMPADEVTPAQIEAFATELGWELAQFESFILELNYPVVGGGALEADLRDPAPHKPWQYVSDLIGFLIEKHFGPDARRYTAPPEHASIAYGAPGPDGQESFLFDSGIVQGRLRRELREGGIEFRVAELSLLKVRQDPSRSTYTWSENDTIRFPLGTGLPGLARGEVGAWLDADAHLPADTAAIEAIGRLEIHQECAAAVLAAPGSQGLARVAALVDAGVLAYRAGRYRLLDDPAPGHAPARDQARARLLDWYLNRVAAALTAAGSDRLIVPIGVAGVQPGESIASFEAGHAWFETERENLRRLLHIALAHGLDQQCWQLAALWCGHLATISDFTPWREAVDAGARATEQAGDQPGLAALLEYRSKLLSQSGEHELATTAADQALALRTKISDETGRMRSLNTLGLTQLRGGQFEAAAENLQRARDEADRLDAVDFRVAARVNLAILFNSTGRHAEAEAEVREAVDLLDPDRHIALLADAQQELGRALCGQGRLGEAVAAGRRAVDAAHRCGSRTHQAMSLISLAETHSVGGEHDDAMQAARAACLAARRPGDPGRIRRIFARAAHIAQAAGNAELASSLTAASGA